MILRRRRRPRVIVLAAAALLGLAQVVYASPPPVIPGDDITDQEIESTIARDTIAKRAPTTARQSSGWLDDAVKTWDAPSLSQQLAEDTKLLKLGMGAVYVPRMTEGPLEPDVEIVDSAGGLAARGETGTRYLLMPGIYFVMVGNGSHKQMMVRAVSVVEGRTTPVTPDWSALSVETTDEDGMPLRGEFELVNMDKFDPYGRGFGPDPDLGEKPRTWLLRPGLYKIFSVGESYNTQRNFITVQLLPGQLVRVLLVLNKTTMRVQGGGIVRMNSSQSLARHWKYGLDVGGGALFGAAIDRSNPDTTVTTNSTTISLLLNVWLRYERSQSEWNTSLRLNEGFSFTIDSSGLQDFTGSDDEPRLQSLYIWRFLRWLGPYGRFEMQTALFPKFERRVLEDKAQFYIIDRDGLRERIDLNSSLQSEPSLSPLDVGMGAGANADILDLRFVETRTRLGFGYSYKSIRDKLIPVPASSIDPGAQVADSAEIAKSKVLQNEGSARTHEAGPEAALTAEIRLWHWGTTGAEIKLFGPVYPQVRILNPDIMLEAYVSWRLTRAITLDYRYDLTIEQPTQEQLQVNKSQHRVQLRYSFSSQ